MSIYLETCKESCKKRKKFHYFSFCQTFICCRLGDNIAQQTLHTKDDVKQKGQAKKNCFSKVEFSLLEGVLPEATVSVT